MSSLICPNCGYQTENSEPFCYKCGTKMAHAEEKVSCPFCGVKVKQDSAFCSHCGKSLNVQSGKSPVVDDKHEIKPNTDAQECMHKETKNLAAKTIVSDPVIEKLKSEAEQGNAEAQKKLGQFYLDGNEVEQDNVEALYWFRKAAEQGNAEAQHMLGDFYSSGLDAVVPNQTKADEWYKKAAEQGSVDDQIELGQSFWDRGDHKEAIKWFSKAAEQGNADAQCRLGDCYKSLALYNPSDYQKYEIEAINWWRKGAEQGDHDAQRNLADYYHFGGFRSSTDDDGDMNKQNLIEAEKWYQMAAEQHGDSFAQEMRNKLSAYNKKGFTKKDIFKISVIRKLNELNLVVFLLLISSSFLVAIYTEVIRHSQPEDFDNWSLTALHDFTNASRWLAILAIPEVASLIGFLLLIVLARLAVKKRILCFILISAIELILFLFANLLSPYMPDWRFSCVIFIFIGGSYVFYVFCNGLSAYAEVCSVLKTAFPVPDLLVPRWKTIKKMWIEQKTGQQ